MLKRALITTMLLLASHAVLSQSADASYRWTISYYSYDLYYGLPETVYDLYVVYEDGTEKKHSTYFDTASASNQMTAFAKGQTEDDFVSWYLAEDYRTVRWYFYSNYKTFAEADSNASWLEQMGFDTDIELRFRR